MTVQIGTSIRLGALVSLALFVPMARSPGQYTPPSEKSRSYENADSIEIVMTEEAAELHRTSLVIDGHNDLPGVMRRHSSSFDKMDISTSQQTQHTDIPRLRQGGLGGQFWSAYVPASLIERGGAARHCLEQIDVIHRMVERYPETFEFARTADDIVRIQERGKIASMIGIEGGHAIENSLGTLRSFYRLGARYMTLTHSRTHDWADSCTDEPEHGGLSEFGERVVMEMNRIGMFVDISHVSPDCMRDVLRIVKAPVIASHSSALAIKNHPRNVPDDVLQLVATNGGVIMVNFASVFIAADDPEYEARKKSADKKYRELHADNDEVYRRAMRSWRRANRPNPGTIHDLISHIEHVKKVAGVDHVGLGADYDGVGSLPKQIEDVSTYPYVTQALLNSGHSKEDVQKILGGNLIRAMREMERVAREMRAR